MQPLTTDPAQLVDDLRTGLAALADPVKAPAMQAYMKSAMPFLGVTAPARAELAKPLLRRMSFSDSAQWRATVMDLWDNAKYREERYLALTLATHRRSQPYQDADAIGLYRHLITTGAWWDYVDTVAGHLLSPHRRADPVLVDPVVVEWAVDEDMWLRRAAILSQLGSRHALDYDLLDRVLSANLGDKRFFIAKAIGWALREVVRVNPDWVRAFLAANADTLVPLSVREASKHLKPPDAESGTATSLVGHRPGG